MIDEETDWSGSGSVLMTPNKGYSQLSIQPLSAAACHDSCNLPLRQSEKPKSAFKFS